MSIPPEGVSSSKPMPQNHPYTYSKFLHTKLKKKNQKGIRLFELLPGSFEDAIKLRIFHAALRGPKSERKRPIMHDELKNTLPLGWKMFHTSTGRYIFSFAGTNGLKSAWTHPDSTYQYLVEDTSFDDNDQDSLSFEAISYARGSTQDPLQALIEYPSQPRGFAYLDIGQNLANALRHLHVFRLAGIFSRASRAVIWLGPVSEDSSEAFDKLRHLGEQAVSVEDDWVPSPGTVEPDWYRPDYKLPFSREIISAIEKLLRRDWFRRMWVLQEIILASSQSIIHCGHSQIPWIVFSNAVCSLESKGDQFPKSFQDVLQAPVRMTPDPKPWSIADIFRRYRTHQTTDPRDKGYGLLGLLSLEFRQKITPDYNAPVVKVYSSSTPSVSTCLGSGTRRRIERQIARHGFWTFASPSTCGNRSATSSAR
jgi:hypothetical protein